MQVHDSLRAYGKHLRLASTTIYGGAGMQPQIDALRRGVDIWWPPRAACSTISSAAAWTSSRVDILVLDEADRMLDMGFLPAIKRVMAKIPTRRQTLLFSATFEDAIKKLAMEFLREPKEVQVTVQQHRRRPTSPTSCIRSTASRKRDLLLDILSKRYQDQALVFGRTKHGCNRLAEQLDNAGIKSRRSTATRARPSA